VKDKVEQAGYVQNIGTIVGIDESLIWDLVNKSDTKQTTKQLDNTLQKMDIQKPKKLTAAINGKELHIIGLLLQNPYLRDKEMDWELISSTRLLDTYQHLVGAKTLEQGISTLPEEDQELGTDL